MGGGNSRLRRAAAMVALTAVACAAPVFAPAPLAAQRYDVLIVGGTVVDGTGAERFRADVAVADGRIALVSTDRIDPSLAATVIDATGQVVTPGFIDNHAHVQQTIAEYPLAENFLRQGITTLIASLHSGNRPWPLEEFASGLEMAPNVGFFAGHTWTRKQVMGMENRAPTAEELEEMKALVDRSMREGALGLSTGLLYVPANFAETEEVIELARVAAAHGGIYVSHMRNEASGLLESVREVIRIAEEADIPAQINHHKAAGAAQWGWSEYSLALIDSANAAGLTVTHDLYPYAASSTGSSILFPQWALAGGAEDFAARVADPETRARMVADMRVIFMTDRVGADVSRIQDMGVIAEGMRADIAVFDPDVIADRATFSDPHQYSVGITDLLVNGVPVIRGGGLTGEKPGRWIRGPVRRPVS